MASTPGITRSADGRIKTIRKISDISTERGITQQVIGRDFGEVAPEVDLRTPISC